MTTELKPFLKCNLTYDGENDTQNVEIRASEAEAVNYYVGRLFEDANENERMCVKAVINGNTYEAFRLVTDSDGIDWELHRISDCSIYAKEKVDIENGECARLAGIAFMEARGFFERRGNRIWVTKTN